MMRVPLILLALLLESQSAFAQTEPPSAPAQATPGDAAAGRRAFMDYACYYCHGTVGQGSLPRVGPRVARSARSLESFIAYVRRPAGRMSSYPDAVISDEALADIYTYLRELPEPAKPLPPVLEALRQR